MHPSGVHHSEVDPAGVTMIKNLRKLGAEAPSLGLGHFGVLQFIAAFLRPIYWPMDDPT